MTNDSKHRHVLEADVKCCAHASERLESTSATFLPMGAAVAESTWRSISPGGQHPGARTLCEPSDADRGEHSDVHHGALICVFGRGETACVTRRKRYFTD